MKLNVCSPAPAGSAMLRDLRTWVSPRLLCRLWQLFKMSRPTSLKTLTNLSSMRIGQHGGTPNLSKEVRAIPHPGTFWAPWYRGGELTRNLP